MFASGFVAPCIRTRAVQPPSGPGWVHKIKHDGYRLIVRRDGKTVRLFTRAGHDWTDRYPAISAVAARLRSTSSTLDGEAAVSGADGVAVFEGTPPPARGARYRYRRNGLATTASSREAAISGEALGVLDNVRQFEIRRHSRDLGLDNVRSCLPCSARPIAP